MRVRQSYLQNAEAGLLVYDMDVTDCHEDIIAARSSNNKGFTPFILINVKEGDNEYDVTEPDLMAMSSTYLKSGMRNIKLTVELTNLENYQLNFIGDQIQRPCIVDQVIKKRLLFYTKMSGDNTENVDSPFC